MNHLTSMIFACDNDTGMKSKKSKYLHEILGKPIIKYVYESIINSDIKDCIIVTGNSNEIESCFSDKVNYITLDDNKGFPERIIELKEILKTKIGCLIVLWGDMPLLSPDSISDAVRQHFSEENCATAFSTGSDNEKQCGIFCFNINEFIDAVSSLNNCISFDDQFFSAVLDELIKKGLKTGTIMLNNSYDLIRVTDRIMLAKAARILNNRTAEKHMKEGVTIIDPDTTYIDTGVNIGIDTIIYPGTIIEGKTIIGEDCIIGPYSRITNSDIGDRVEIKNSVIIESCIGNNSRIGPFAYIRPESTIGNNVKIGDFVEIKKSCIDDGTSVAHLTYIGDAEIGKNVNMGCGVVVVNYDGKEKHKTVVEDNAFIGCNVNLVSPVLIKNNAFVAAGSTITETVPEDSLAIARNKQVNKLKWNDKRK